MWRIRTAVSWLAILACGWAWSAQAAGYPARTITLVVPFPPGGVVDIVGRVVAERLGASLGQQVVVENVTGAGGTIGASRVARAAPDGYTIMLGGAATQVFGPALHADLSYDPVKSFVPIGQVSAESLVLVVSKSLPVDDYAQFIAYVKAHGEATNYASNGLGTFPQLCVELLKQSTGIRATHIPYPGGAQSMIALLAGDVTFSINHMPVVLPQIRAGKVKALAVTGASRSPLLPEVPTFRELGVGNVQASAWWGLYAPAGTASAIIEKLNGTLNAVLKEARVKDALLRAGDEVAGGSPQDLAQYQQRELAKWPAVMKAAGVKVE